MYPTRLIDVAPEGFSSGFWRLVEVHDEVLTGPFMTLSHRWGSGTIKLERGTQHLMLGGMPLSILPGTYQDAIKVVKDLNVRYLWIDSICIFQDERTDIQKEATRMAEVYGSAICNISALSGKDNGLFCTRTPEIMNSDSVILDQATFQLNTSFLINDLQLWRGELIHMPLTNRGWVLQEEVLAPRTIYFGSRQVLWNCLHSRSCETYPSLHPKRQVYIGKSTTDKGTFLDDDELEPITSWLSFVKQHSNQDDLPGLTLNQVDQKILYKVWTDFVAHYSLRQLTFPIDKLLAIAGVSKLFGTVMRDDFIAGLWRQHLMEGLLWYIRVNTRTASPSEYRAPTWSWASKDGYVIHAPPFNASWIVARALDVQCNVISNECTAPPQQFGVVTSGTMTLQAPLIQIRISEDGNWIVVPRRHHISVPQLTIRVDTSDIIPAGEEYTGAIIRTTAYHLTDVASDHVGKKVLLAAQGVLLKATGQSSTQTQRPSSSSSSDEQLFSYTRVGYFGLEDRRSGTLTPRWAPAAADDSGSAIFPPPVKQADLPEFDFGKATRAAALSIVEVL
ncbi:uncharacterized protein A1O9_07372 [Exophiala aquamarina CBS 119918]|uniref:Heterokaryon incompatibility domain-containing protein n=1 Tax=Exophiala aquamarina CBS 119918 TaxID=1182545 RepID=A0A072PBP4_9EURO|nr:uncharacterized protein A1O9_07372 [Exophiala aquamarina CBS 119918]KEF57182.1 hypothetical protein A1O9_07372 [Exophiala aquamarina CBS 119918]